MFHLMNSAITLVLFVSVVMLGKAGFPYLLFLPFLYVAATVVPSLSSLIRRLHDTGRSGWWFWISLIPLFGEIAILKFAVDDSQPGKNQYGPNPKQQTNTEANGSPEMGYLAPPRDP